MRSCLQRQLQGMASQFSRLAGTGGGGLVELLSGVGADAQAEPAIVACLRRWGQQVGSQGGIRRGIPGVRKALSRGFRSRSR